MPVGSGNAIVEHEIFERVENDHILDPGRRVGGEVDLVGVRTAVHGRGGVFVVGVAFGHDFLVKAEVAGGERDYVVRALSVDELLGVGVGVKIGHQHAVDKAAAVIGKSVADIVVAGLVRHAVEHVVAEFGYGVPGMAGLIVEAVRPLCGLGYADDEQRPAGTVVVGYGLVRILVGIESVTVRGNDKGRFIEVAAVRKQIVKHAGLLFNVNTFAVLDLRSLVHRDRPGKQAALLERIVLETYGLLYFARAGDAYDVIHTGRRSRLFDRTVIVVHRGARGVDDGEFVLSDRVSLVHYIRDLFAAEQSGVRFRTEGGAVMLIGGDQTVARAGAVAEGYRFAAGGDAVRRAFGSRSEGRVGAGERAHFDPLVCSELSEYLNSFVGLVGDSLGLEALGRSVEVSVEHRVRYHDLVETVFAGQELDSIVIILTDHSYLNGIIGEFDGRGDLEIAVGVVSVRSLGNGQRVSGGGGRGIPRQVRDGVGGLVVIIVEREAAYVFGIVNALILEVVAVFIKRKAYAAAGMEHGVFVSPALGGVCVGGTVYFVQRVDVSVSPVGEGIGRLRVVSRFEMSGDDVVVTAAGIAGRLIGELAAVFIRNGDVAALPLHLDGDDFAIRHVEGVGEREIVALSRGDIAADLPDQIIILAVVVGGRLSPGRLPGRILLLRSVFFHLGDLGSRVDIDVRGVARLGMFFVVAGNYKRRLEFGAGVTVFGSRSVGVVIHIIVCTLVGAVPYIEIAVLSRGTRQAVIYNYFFFAVFKRFNPVNEHVVVRQVRIVFERKRDIEIIRRLAIVILEDGIGDMYRYLFLFEIIEFA